VRSPDLRAAATRLSVLRALLLVVFLVLAARAAHLSVVDERGAGAGGRQVHTTLELPPARGLIVDREGMELAVTVEAPSVYVLPDELPAGPEVARALAGALGLDRRQVAKRVRGRERFTFVARWVKRERAEAVEALGIPGIGIVRESRRAYPGGELAAHLLGFANIDGVGVRGIEQKEDRWLRGSRRVAPVERDGGGRLLAAVALEPKDAAGGDVLLTLDARMQSAAESALRQALSRSGARGGSVLTLDPRSGDILALAEAPRFDPNRFRETDYGSTRSRAFLDAVEPGSTLKIFLVAAALEDGAISKVEAIDCRGGRLRIPGKTVRDARDHGWLDAGGVIRVSSNVGAVRIAQRLGAAPHFEALRRFGFGRSTGSGFPVESAGLLRSWKSWKPVDQASIAYGQGIGVTQVQLAAATATLANGGRWQRPRIVAARRDGSRPWRWEPVEAGRRVVSAETAASVLSMMESVVGPSGTGRRAGLRGLRVAGKTGTAQKLDTDAGRYSQDRFISWFVGVVPADDPRLVIVVSLDEPQRGIHSGGSSAAPLFAQVAAGQLGRLGILTAPEPIPAAAREAVETPPGNPPAATRVVSGEAIAPAEPASGPPSKRQGPVAATGSVEIARDGNRVLLPDFRGLSVEEVVRITSENALELEVHGEGRAVSQDPDPGTILAGDLRRVRVRFARPAGGARGEG
jgi:cell division protein FtsI (penicillin-binding protein 3)